MSVRPHRYTTWQELDEYMGDRVTRSLGWNNTRCVRNTDGTLSIQVHHRIIVQLRDDGVGGTAVRVRDQGFPTYLTRDRINLFVPAHWWCERKGNRLIMRYDGGTGPMAEFSGLSEVVDAMHWSSWMLDTDQGQVPRVHAWGPSNGPVA